MNKIWKWHFFLRRVSQVCITTNFIGNFKKGKKKKETKYLKKKKTKMSNNCIKIVLNQ